MRFHLEEWPEEYGRWWDRVTVSSRSLYHILHFLMISLRRPWFGNRLSEDRFRGGYRSLPYPSIIYFPPVHYIVHHWIAQVVVLIDQIWTRGECRSQYRCCCFARIDNIDRVNSNWVFIIIPLPHPVFSSPMPVGANWQRNQANTLWYRPEMEGWKGKRGGENLDLFEENLGD